MSKNILVVDDDPLILMGLEIMLSDAGYTVACCSNGENTVEKVRDFKPDAIILDVMLADLDGRDIARKLKASTATKHIPIIMISANQYLERDIYSCGTDVFIPKPFEMDHMLNVIEQYVGEKSSYKISQVEERMQM